MSWLRRYRVAHALALFALWAQLLWPALAMAGGPDSIAICTGNGLRYVVDPAAPAAPAVTHDCPCCVVQAQGGMPSPESPALRLPDAGDQHVSARPLPLVTVRDDGLRPWGRAPPTV